MTIYPIGTKRLIRAFVIRKRIGDNVLWLQSCCWEEEFQYHPGYDNSWTLGFNPTRFISGKEFDAEFSSATR